MSKQPKIFIPWDINVQTHPKFFLFCSSNHTCIGWAVILNRLLHGRRKIWPVTSLKHCWTQIHS